MNFINCVLRTQIPNLGVGFALRCFQRLSLPNIATRRFSWYQSRYTRGPFSQVLSSRIPLFLGAQTISSPSLVLRKLLTYADFTQTYAEFLPRESASSLRLSAASQSEAVGCRRIT